MAFPVPEREMGPAPGLFTGPTGSYDIPIVKDKAPDPALPSRTVVPLSRWWIGVMLGAGTIGGIMNFVNNLMGAVAPVVTGYIVAVTGSLGGAFLVAGVALVVGIFAYVVVLGPIEPIPEPATARAPPRGARTG